MRPAPDHRATPLGLGEFAPWFSAPSPTNTDHHFSTAAGRYVVLAFLPPPGAACDAAKHMIGDKRALFDDRKLAVFMVVGHPTQIAEARNYLPGVRWYFDPAGTIARQFGLRPAETTVPYWFLLDPAQRVIAASPIRESEPIFSLLDSLPPLADYGGVPMVAPVLVVPRVLEPEICRRLIALYEAQGGSPSGVMRDVGGRTVGVLDNFKSRRDVTVEDEAFRNQLRLRILKRLLPEISKAFNFEATRMERYMVACYDADEGGHFGAHRDNETLGTAHRRFAVSINLNAEEFEGGEVRFPEFGPQTYRPPTGGAVVFCCSLQHEVTPVTKGRRYAYLPFLYDDAGAAIREANLAFVVAPES